MNPTATRPVGLLSVTLLLIAMTSCASHSSPGVPPEERPVLIATWPMGQEATEKALEVMLAGGSSLDGIEQGIRLLEARSADGSVGAQGRPNAAGYTQVDACIMNGPGQAAGSVAGVEGIVHPISAARLVMERSPHVMLVGEGARWFALEHGLESLDVSGHDAMKESWRNRELDPVEPADRGHDTITVLALDADGNLSGGCSTSGAAGKLPGRVGDSPILGGGLFVDNAVGAAGATGLGENVMRYCATSRVVELMRQGLHPQEACEAVIHQIAAVDPEGYDLSISFIALDKQGRVGAASSSQRFPYAVTTRTSSALEHVEVIERAGSD